MSPDTEHVPAQLPSAPSPCQCMLATLLMTQSALSNPGNRVLQDAEPGSLEAASGAYLSEEEVPEAIPAAADVRCDRTLCCLLCVCLPSIMHWLFRVLCQELN